MNTGQLDHWLKSQEYKALLDRIHSDAAVALRHGISVQEVRDTISALCDEIEESIVYEPIRPAPVRMHPQQWCHKFGVEVIDPDGWRTAKMDYHTPITQDQFVSLFCRSTTGFVDRQKYTMYKHLFR